MTSEFERGKQPPHRIQTDKHIDKTRLTLPMLDDPQARRAAALAEITHAITASLSGKSWSSRCG